MKKETLITPLQDHALMWYIKYCIDNLRVELADIQTTLNKEFGRSKSKVQPIMGFKEIIMNPGETHLDLDQILKCKICEASMNLMDGQHRKWFVDFLLPHLSVALSQKGFGARQNP